MTEREFIEMLLTVFCSGSVAYTEFGVDEVYRGMHTPQSDVVFTFASGERFRVVVTREV